MGSNHRRRGLNDYQLLCWAQAHTGGGQESSVAIGVLRLLSEKYEAIEGLLQPTEALAAAVAANKPNHTAKESDSIMAAPNPILDPLEAQVTSTVGVMQSAVALISGFAAAEAAAIQQALANGATADQLAPLTTLNTQLKAQTDALAAAVAANTPPAP